MNAAVIPLYRTADIPCELHPAEQRERLAQAMHDRYRDRFWRLNDRLVLLDPDTGKTRPVDKYEFRSMVPEAAAMSRPMKGKDNAGQRETIAVPVLVIDDVYNNRAFAPELEGIVHCPWIDADGRLVTTPGYDEKSRTWLHWDGGPVDLEDVTREDVREVLDRLLCYDYAVPIDKAHALAVYLYAVRGPAMWQGSTPMALYLANTHEAGKTTASQLPLMLVAGCRDPVKSDIGDGATERTYSMSALLQEGQPIVWIDNIATGSTVGGSQLQAILTSQGRILSRKVGSSNMGGGDPRRVLWVGTGNQLDMDHETARRILPIRLGVTPGKTWPSGDPIEWMWRHRRRVVSVLLRLVANWYEAGCPPAPRCLASFERWSSLIGGPVCFALPELAGDWMDRRHRPVPQVDLQLAWMFEANFWPKDEQGQPRRMRATWIYETARELELFDVVGMAANATAFGKKLAEKARAGVPIQGWRLHYVTGKGLLPRRVGGTPPPGSGINSRKQRNNLAQDNVNREADPPWPGITQGQPTPGQGGQGGQGGSCPVRTRAREEAGDHVDLLGFLVPAQVQAPVSSANFDRGSGLPCPGAGSSWVPLVDVPPEDPGFDAIYTLAKMGVRVDPQLWLERAETAGAALIEDRRRAEESGDGAKALQATDRLKALQSYRYVVASRAQADPQHRVRCRWVLQGTGRLGTVDPPLQQITKAHGLRQAIVPAPGHRFIVADWKAAHLWIAAALARDEALLDALIHGDVYTEAAADWPGDIEEAARRKLGKRVILSSLNGAGAAKLAGIARAFGSEVADVRAVDLREGWLARYPRLRDLLLDIGNEREWTSPLGRQIRVPDVLPNGRRSHKGTVQAWHWQAVESDALRTVLDLSEERARVVLTNHDEIVWEVPESEVDEVRSLAGWWMDRALGRVAQIDALMSRDIVDGETYTPASAVVDVRRSWAKEDACA